MERNNQIKKHKVKDITLRTKPNSIQEQFKQTFEKGGEINLDLGDGNFIYAVGGHGAILSKLQNNNHFIAQDNKWVEVN